GGGDTGTPRDRVVAVGVLEEGSQLVAVAGAPGGGVPAQEAGRGDRFIHGALPPARRAGDRRAAATARKPRRSAPSSARDRMSCTASASAVRPLAVIRYGRRRSSPAVGSMKPRCSR